MTVLVTAWIPQRQNSISGSTWSLSVLSRRLIRSITRDAAAGNTRP